LVTIYNISCDMMTSHVLIVCCVSRVFRLFTGLQTVLSNSSVVDSLVNLLTDVNSLMSLADSMLTVPTSCMYCL